MAQRYGPDLGVWRSVYVALAGLLLVAMAAGAALDWSGATAFADITITGLAFLAVGLAWRRARFLGNPARLAWTMLGGACLLWGFGHLVWTYAELKEGATQAPLVADVAYLMLIPFAASALLVLVVGTTTNTSRARILLDALLVATSCLFVAYAISLRPFITALRHEPDAVERAISLAYPFGDLFLLALLFLVMVRVPPATRKALFWLACALMGIALSNFGNWYAADAYPRVWADLGRMGGFLFVIYTAIRPITDPPFTSSSKPGGLLAAGPLIPFVLCIMVAVQLQVSTGVLEPFLFWSAVILILLLATRQFFHVHENFLLRRQADAALETVRTHEASRTQMLNNITHDMRHHLSPAVMHLGMMEVWDDPLSDRQRRSLGIIKRSTDQVTRLAGDLADAVSLQAGRFAVQKDRVDVAQVARDAADSLRTRADERGVHLTVDAPAPVPVSGDRDRLLQVLFNLLSNAIRFTPAGASVRIAAATRGHQAHIEVTDTGRGLEADEAGRLFQPFIQVHKRGEAEKGGMGLGLYISRGIVEQHGGTIGVRSPGRGKGSTFFVEIPLAPPDAPTPQPASPTLAA